MSIDYVYRREGGSTAFIRRRHPEPGLHKKRFETVMPDGSTCADPPFHLLYRLPELLAGDPGETVYITEGEKDADRLAGLGLIATTNPGGCRFGWSSVYGPYFRGRNVVVLPDNDKVGLKRGELVMQSLRGVAATCVTVELPAPRGGGDVSDWMGGNRAQGTRGTEELAQRVAAARYALAGMKARMPAKIGKLDLIFKSGLPPSLRLLLIVLMELSYLGPPAEPNVSLAARCCGLHRVTAQRVVKDLRDRGVLDRHSLEVRWDVLAALGGQT